MLLNVYLIGLFLYQIVTMRRMATIILFDRIFLISVIITFLWPIFIVLDLFDESYLDSDKSETIEAAYRCEFPD